MDHKKKNNIIFLLSLLLIISIVLNIFLGSKKNPVIQKYIANNIIEIFTCTGGIEESLQALVDGTNIRSEEQSLIVVSDKFDKLASLCHSNRYIFADASSDFSYIGSTFIGYAATRNFVTVGIYDDLTITENERKYFSELIKLINKLEENVSISNVKYDIDALNSNLEYIHEQLYDTNNSPFLLIKEK